MSVTHIEMARSRCPSCRVMIRRQEISLDTPFKCPSCRLNLSVSAFYSHRFYVVSWLLTAVVSYALGARGCAFVLAGLVGFSPIFFLLILLGKFFDPPQLKVSDDYSLNLNTRGGRG